MLAEYGLDKPKVMKVEDAFEDMKFMDEKWKRDN
jgi:hypothetical protein